MGWKIGDIIEGKYTIIDDVGAGGMGRVFKVQFTNLIVALKMFINGDEEGKRRFKREIRIMQNINDEHVIEVLDFNPDFDGPYFTMPLCTHSLDKKIHELKYDHQAAIRILIDACKGVAAIHKAGNIHRDIKPANILIDANGQVKVSDLGLAKFVDRDSTILTKSDDTLGTTDYMPPEFWEDKGSRDATIAGDVFQLGKTIYNVLTGKRPLYIESNILPGGIEYVIKVATETNPAKRYASVDDLIAALENYLVSLDSSIDPEVIFQGHIDKANEIARNSSYEGYKAFLPVIFDYAEHPEKFFMLSKKLPERLLSRFATEEPELLKIFLGIYESTIEKYFDRPAAEYEDAVTVASLMKRVFESSEDLPNKIDSLRIALLAAVRKNRYDAMDIVKDMLGKIKDNDQARSVAAMLRVHKEQYDVILNKHPDMELHYLIKAVK